jgi:hypothetical protein
MSWKVTNSHATGMAVTYQVLVEITPTDATPFNGNKSLSRSWLGKRNFLYSYIPLAIILGGLHYCVGIETPRTLSNA